MKLFLLFWGMAAGALLVSQPPSADIVTGQVDQSRAAANRVIIEGYSGAKLLPAGEIWVDRAPKPQSGVTLVGNGTTIKQQFTGGNYPLNSTLAAPNDSIGHVSPITHAGPQLIVVDQAVAAKCPPGTVVYTFVNEGYKTGGQKQQRRLVLGRQGVQLKLDAAIYPEANAIKWLGSASPINNVQEGMSAIVVTRNVGIEPTWVFVTGGPYLANEATGEIRRVVNKQGNIITLDRPLRRSYTQAAVAYIQPTTDVTLKNLTLDLPLHPQAECLYASFAVNWRVEGCRIPKVALGNCANVTFKDCDLGWLYVAASSHDILADTCKIVSTTFEEGCFDSQLYGCQLGPVGKNMNVVSILMHSERIRIRNSVLLGGASPCSQILMFTPSREIELEDLMMFGRAPCWLRAGVIQRARVVSDGEIHFQ